MSSLVFVSSAWLKIEPIDVFPYPRTHMSE